jgi:hypothetical protein
MNGDIKNADRALAMIRQLNLRKRRPRRVLLRLRDRAAISLPWRAARRNQTIRKRGNEIMTIDSTYTTRARYPGAFADGRDR